MFYDGFKFMYELGVSALWCTGSTNCGYLKMINKGLILSLSEKIILKWCHGADRLGVFSPSKTTKAEVLRPCCHKCLHQQELCLQWEKKKETLVGAFLLCG